ncbi:Uncharacterised protein [Mycobacteroides abscessus]|nr:Uncharacterised protein [Mycobacteroides abscessus]
MNHAPGSATTTRSPDRSWSSPYRACASRSSTSSTPGTPRSRSVTRRRSAGSCWSPRYTCATWWSATANARDVHGSSCSLPSCT